MLDTSKLQYRPLRDESELEKLVPLWDLAGWGPLSAQDLNEHCVRMSNLDSTGFFRQGGAGSIVSYYPLLMKPRSRPLKLRYLIALFTIESKRQHLPCYLNRNCEV